MVDTGVSTNAGPVLLLLWPLLLLLLLLLP